MTNQKPPPLTPAIQPHDPYKMRSLEWLLELFDGGEFLTNLMDDHQTLQQDLLAHLQEHGPKGCSGSMTLKINYAVGNAGDVSMGAEVAFKAPKKPASSAAAFINEKGELTLYSPMMKRMQQPPRDVTDYDPATGEIRNTD
jgi:hypothetical protein